MIYAYCTVAFMTFVVGCIHERHIINKAKKENKGIRPVSAGDIVAFVVMSALWPLTLALALIVEGGRALMKFINGE